MKLSRRKKKPNWQNLLLGQLDTDADIKRLGLAAGHFHRRPSGPKHQQLGLSAINGGDNSEVLSRAQLAYLAGSHLGPCLTVLQRATVIKTLDLFPLRSRWVRDWTRVTAVASKAR